MPDPMPTSTALEQLLEAAGHSLRYPPTPLLAQRVGARLRSAPAPRRAFRVPVSFPRSRLLRGVVATVIVAALAVGITAALSPTASQALARFFGLERIRIVPIEETPTVPPAATEPAAVDPIVGRTTLVEAQQRAAFTVRIPTYPAGLGDPTAVYFQDFRPGQQVVLRYGPQPGNAASFMLFQLKVEGIFMKLTPPGTQVEELRVGQERAFWFQGAAHILQYRDPSGTVRTEFERLVTLNTLAWEMGPVTYRLETSLPKEEALKIAASLQGLPPR